MALAVKDVYVDPVLSNVSVRYSNPNLIADKIFPVLEVEKRTGFFFTYNKDNIRIPVSTKRTGFERANRVSHDLTKTAYGPLTERSIEEGIEADVLAQYADPLDPKMDATLNVTEKVLLERERDLATDLANTAVVTQNTTLSGTGQWSDYTNSDPLVALQSYVSTMKLNSVGISPNTFFCGQQVWDQLKNHPKVVDRLKYTTSESVAMETFARLIGVSQVFLGDSVQNSAVEGQTDSLGFLWGKNAWLAYITPTPGIRTLSAGYHLTLRGARFIDTWTEQWNKGTFVRFNDYYDRKIVAGEALYLIKNAVA